ncbi:MAG: WG repeat-containing protein [Tissierellia bacterium]|nr:WG repeat-containing protein [Tissierellia bacterium]
MKKVLLALVIIFLLLLNAFAVYAVVDTLIFQPRAQQKAIEAEKAQTEADEVKETEKKDSSEVTIGVPEDVLKEREEAQRALEEAMAKSEEKMSITDDFSTKIADLANPMLEHNTMDFSEYIIKEIKDGKIIAAQAGSYQYGVMDLEKNEILPFAYEDIDISDEGFYMIKKGGKMGILDQDGLRVADNNYDTVEEIIKGYYLCKAKDMGGNYTSKIFNRNGDEVFSVGKNVVSVFEENTNFFKFEENGKYGIVDINGEERLKADFDDLILKDGKLYFKQGTDIGVIE